MIDFRAVEEGLAQAMRMAAANPGPYGGRYFARRYNKELECTDYVVLDTDDPLSIPALDKELDLLAHVRPDKVYPFGRARYWIREDGTVNQTYFGPPQTPAS